jgi:hypothetical protein
MNKYVTYGLQGLLVLFFIIPGVMKVTAQPMIVEAFTGFGYSLSFMYFIGACEIAGALGIAFGGRIHAYLPQLAVLGLLIIMIGALVSHTTAGDPVTAMIPATINVLLLSTYMYILRKQAATVLR